jgi:hypothetical protein
MFCKDIVPVTLMNQAHFKEAFAHNQSFHLAASAQDRKMFVKNQKSNPSVRYARGLPTS